MNKKVCHLTSVHKYLDIRIFIKECQSLAKHGFETHLIAPNAPDEIIEGVYVHGVDNKNGNRASRMTRTVTNVYKKALDINAEVYHFHDPELLIVGWLLKRKGFKVIYDAHEDLPRAILSKYWIPKALRKISSILVEIVEDFFAKRCNLIICATPFISERYKNISHNVVNINNFPKLAELYQLGKDNLPFSNRKIVSYIGGIAKIRGVEEILNGSDYLEEKISIVMAGPVPESYKFKIEEKASVRYIGIIDRDEVKSTLGKSITGLVTFLPEPNHVNAQPNKMFEYMSAGIPVICSDFPLWRKIIETHECGICVDPENPAAIAKAINYLYNHPVEAEQMGRNGRMAIEEKFNWEKESKKLIEAYNKLLM